MANTRNVTLITKNSNQPSQPLPASPNVGEAYLNTADGKLYYKGFISGTGSTTYVPSLFNNTYFEVGSHISQLKLDDKIITYSGVSNLTGQFLSGTSSGFVLAPISSISGIDTYLTGGTFNYGTHTLTLNQNNGGPTITVTGFTDLYVTGATYSNNTLTFTNSTGGTFAATINSFTGLTINGTLSATTISGGTFYGNGSNLIGVATANTFTTASTYNAGTGILTNTRNDGVTYTAGTWNYVSAATLNSNVFSITSNGGSPVTSTINAVTGGTYANGIITVAGSGTLSNITNLPFKTAFTYSNNVFTLTNTTGGTLSATINTVTGLTVNGTLAATNVSATTYLNLPTLISAVTLSSGNVLSVTPYGGSVVNTTINAATGGTYSNGTITLSGSGILGTITGLTSTNIYTTAFTYSNNVFTLTNNTGGTLSALINTVTGFTVNGGLTVTGNTGISGNTTVGGNVTAANLYTTSNGSAIIGTGGLVVGSGGSWGVPGAGDVVINGSLTVYGASVSGFTTNIYAEDQNITLNYNPTANTYNTSLTGGFTVQNGWGVSGLTGDSIFFQIAQTGVPTSYSDAVSKRFWETQLANIMIGSTGGTGTGNYVLQATDILNGGVY
jgi:hypothetical protein